MPRLFDMFAQANQTLDRSQGGLGIGLPVVKKLVEMHGGQINARSEGLGHGSTFEISLPRAQPPLPVPASPVDERSPARRILIVDDNADSGLVAGRIAGDGRASDPHGVLLGGRGWKFAESFEPDIVLLDIGLPEMDGYEVARRLRRLPRGDVLMMN